MSLPTDIAQWVAQHGPCLEGIERLVEHASMTAAWDASTNGSMILFMIRVEERYTDEVRAIVAQHRDAVRASALAAKEKATEGDARLQDLDADYAAALAALATDLKELVPNPFQQT